MWEIGLSDTDLLVDENGIGIGTEWFALNQITELAFLIEGYDGQPTLMRTRVGLRRGRPSSGAKNKIHFVEGGKRHLYQFYLPDRLTMQQLGQVFRIYYERGVSFGECNRGGPTFLFQQVQSKKDLAEMKRREGYGV